ncbi:MAG: fibronectin type III domain-containing protein, partial [Proteobacteria bacterium]|nr:fibronectin type III domain-containing protein [Pseudomonadota bacterium]
QINLSWTDNSTDETGFKITKNNSLINTTDANVTSYSNTSLTCGTTYNYSVQATNASDDSTAITSSATTVACPIEIPNAPSVTHKLTVEKIGNGTITSDYGINCGNDCEQDFADQAEVNLIATPDTDWLFTGWTGDCDTEGLVRLHKDKTCIATFESTVQPVDIIPVDNADTPIDTTDNNPINIPITDVPITDVIDNTTDNSTDIPTDTTDSVDNSNELEIDGNGDGILDSEQIYVITIPDAITGKYLTLESHIGCPIKIASAHIEEEQAFESEDYSFPQGIIYYELQCKKANITMYFHGMSRFRMKPVYKKFGSLIPGDLSTLSWYTLPNVIFNIETVNGKPVATAKFTLIDGELGDNTGVDGRIVDPGGIGFK